MSGKTRDKIKKVALTLFASNGYDATSMEKIALGVGIKKSSLYAFITSKEELFWEIFEDLESQYRAYMEELLADSENMTPPERLYFLFKHYLNCAHNRPKEESAEARAFWNQVMFFPPAALKERLLARALDHEMALGEKYKVIIREGMQQGLIRESSPEEMLFSYYSLRQGFSVLMNVFMTEIPEDQKLARIDKVWHDYWLGIRGK